MVLSCRESILYHSIGAQHLGQFIVTVQVSSLKGSDNVRLQNSHGEVSFKRLYFFHYFGTFMHSTSHTHTSNCRCGEFLNLESTMEVRQGSFDTQLFYGTYFHLKVSNYFSNKKEQMKQTIVQSNKLLQVVWSIHLPLQFYIVGKCFAMHGGKFLSLFKGIQRDEQHGYYSYHQRELCQYIFIIKK